MNAKRIALILVLSLVSCKNTPFEITPRTPLHSAQMEVLREEFLPQPHTTDQLNTYKEELKKRIKYFKILGIEYRKKCNQIFWQNRIKSELILYRGVEPIEFCWHASKLVERGAPAPDLSSIQKEIMNEIE